VDKVIYTIVELSGGKSRWIKVGSGKSNPDGSLSLKLDALPLNGKINVRDVDEPEPKEHSSNRHREG
jgi:hypothetical protein